MKTLLNASIVTSFFPSYLLRCFFILSFCLFSFAFVSLANPIDKVDNMPLAGAYTIGGDDPDFITIQAAVDSLKSCGVSDSVVFNIRDGVYEEQISIPRISGVSIKNTIIFQSESRDSTKVNWFFAADTDLNNYTLKIERFVNFITFRNLTIEARGASFGNVVVASGSFNKFHSNVFKTEVVNSDNSNYAIILSDKFRFRSGYQFHNNVFLNGSFGIHETIDNCFDYLRDTEIQNNIFKNQYQSAVQLCMHEKLLFENNKITNSHKNNGAKGIFLRRCDKGTQIIGNKVIMKEGTGMRFEQMDGAFSEPVTVANNYVFLEEDNNTRGINAYICNRFNFYHNTIHTSNSSGGSSLNLLVGNSNKLINNIIVNYGKGTILSVNSNKYFESDYNNFYNWDNDLTSWFENWKESQDFDEHSSISNPLFLQLGNYQVGNIELSDTGVFIPQINEDIEGGKRDTVAPDIGVYEWNPPAVDVSPIILLNPKPPFESGNQLIEFLVGNTGTDTLRSFNIYWTINNEDTLLFNWVGEIVAGNQDTIRLNGENFIPNQNNTLKIWTSFPNSQLDTRKELDTLYVNNLRTGLAGDYTIGGVNPDYVTIGEAVNYLELAGVLDSVNFNIRDGIYEEQLIIRDYPGSSVKKPLVFQSESKDSTRVILNYYAANENYILKLDRVGQACFKHMTIKNNHEYNGRVIEITPGTQQIELRSNRIIGTTTTGITPENSLVHANSMFYNQSLNLVDNVLLGGSYGFYNTGQSSLFPPENTTIIGNIFQNQMNQAVHLANQYSIIINSNKITTISNYEDYIGIQVSDAVAKEIMGNQIRINHGKGIHLYDVGGVNTFERLLIANNFIQINSTQNLNQCQGIHLRYGKYIKLLHNTIKILNESPESTALLHDCDNIEIKNNILTNLGGGYVNVMEGGNVDIIINNNNLYSNGAFIFKLGVAKFRTLEELHEQISFVEKNSIQADPLFINSEGYQIAQSLLNGAADKNNTLLFDIDGDLRDLNHPDIGADEFDLQKCQAVDLLLEPPVLKSGIYIAGNNITTTGKINKDTTIILRAGNSIQLLPGFHAQAGANFWAQILDCSVALEEQMEVTDTMSTIFLKQVEKSTKITLKTAPNPFKTSTNIQFELPETTMVNLQVYDVNGELVKTLIQNDSYEEGIHRLTFFNENQASTVYFLVLKTEKTQVVRRLMLIR